MIIFSQAPYDLQFVINLYEKRKDQKLFIFVSSRRSNYNFLQELNLNAKIIFLPYISLSSPLWLMLLPFYLLSLKVFFSFFRNHKVYYFSNVHDLVTSFCIKSLVKNNVINFIDIYKRTLKYEHHINPLRNMLYRLMSIIVNIKIGSIKTGDLWLYHIDPPSKLIKQLPEDFVIPKKYLWNPEVNSAKRNVLLFEAKQDQNSRFSNYESQLCEVLDYLVQRDYCLYIKPHPRIGHSKFLNSKSHIRFLKQDLPAEFIDFDAFHLILGIETTAIASLSIRSENVFSLVKIFKYKNEDAKAEMIEYLNDISFGNLRILEELNEIE
jgi:hypothetical protein